MLDEYDQKRKAANLRKQLEEEEENEKDILYESKYLLHKNSTYSLQLNHKNKINDSINLNNHHNQHLNLSSKQRKKKDKNKKPRSNI